MKFWFRLSAIIAFLLIFVNQNAQIIITDPAIPSASSSLTIYYDATLGTAGLKDFTGDVYAHTGVITENSTGTDDWKYVKTNWGENTPETKLTRVSTNLYSLEITPSVREYYGVPQNETITHLAFVFRSADKSKEGKDDGYADILVEVFQEGLNISLRSPKNNSLIESGTQVLVEAAVSETANLSLFLNDDPISSISGTSLSHTIEFSTPGDYWIKLSAITADNSAADSVFVHVLDSQLEENAPENIRNGINYYDETTVQLMLNAPNKESVFVIGDFNNWTPRTDSRMVKDGDNWWITIHDLEPGIEYAFQYLVDGELYIADPYTEKVLDPVNDKWISEISYPNLKAYPAGYTSGITSVFQTAQAPYQWENNDYSPQEKDKLVIYELLVRDFIAAHDWKTLTDTLNYFSGLGVSAIELMPVNEFEGNESWGYNPSFYFAPDKYYGPKKDLQAFVDSCHGRGIAVILDMTLNHSFSQSPLVQLYFDNNTNKVTADNPWYNVDSPNPVYSWGYDFNHESMATQAFVDRVTSHWLTEYDLDGFRFDFTKGFTNTTGDGGAYDAARIAILKRMTDAIWAVNPKTFVIFEHLADNSEEKELSDYGIMLWGNINYNYNEATMGWTESGKSDFSWVSYKKRGWTDPNLVGYMESHDEERLMFKNLAYGNASDWYDIQNLNTALARMELAGAFFFTIPGPKMIWQFGELGYDYSIDENGRVGNKPIRWDYYDVGKRRKLYQVYSALIHLKNTEAAFSTDDFKLSLSYAKKRIELNHSDMDVRIIGNFDVVSQDIDPNFSKAGYWYEYFSGDSIDVEDLNALQTMAPGEYKIFSSKRLKKPEITADINAAMSKPETLLLYPNPAKDFLFVQKDFQYDALKIFDINGRLVKTLNDTKPGQSIDISNLTPGFYFMHTEYRGDKGAGLKFIKR